MHELMPIFKIAGVALVGAVVEKFVESHGHGDKTPMIRLATYVATGWMAIDECYDYMRRIGGKFGVYF